MASNLLDAMRQNNVQATQPQGVTDQTATLQGLLRAKSGKDVGGGSGAAASNLGEQQAVTQTNQQLQQQVAPKAEAQVQQAVVQQSGIQQQTNQQASAISQARKFDTIQNNMQVNNVLSQFERGEAQLGQQKSQAQLEQVGATLRLQNTQYVDNLQRQGNLSRLDDANQFSQQMANTVFDNNATITGNQRLNNAILNNNQNAFKQEIANMDVDSAYSMFSASQSAAQAQANWGAGTEAVKGGISAYGTYQNSQSSSSSAEPSSNEAASEAANTSTMGDFSSGGMGGVA